VTRARRHHHHGAAAQFQHGAKQPLARADGVVRHTRRQVDISREADTLVTVTTGEPTPTTRAPMTLTPEQADRASGVLLAQAVGDALGVPYEFATPPPGEPEMMGGGLGDLAPGEWSDDTQVSVCIARVAATGADLTSTTALDAVAAAFEGWLTGGASDVGIQTRAVLEVASRATGPAGIRLMMAAREYTASHPHSAGNGALMRTSVVGLTRLDDREHTAAAARAIAELTHANPLALDSSVLWSDAVRRAVLFGHLDLTAGLDPSLTASAGAGGPPGSPRPPAPTPPVSHRTGSPSPRSPVGCSGRGTGRPRCRSSVRAPSTAGPACAGPTSSISAARRPSPPTAGQSGAHPPGAHAPRADR
jgi:hypothetical protein